MDLNFDAKALENEFPRFVLVMALMKAFPNAKTRMSELGNIIIEGVGDNRDNTVAYGFYVGQDNFLYIRRYVQPTAYPGQPVTCYQLHRNSRTNVWSGFATAQEAIDYFKSYLKLEAIRKVKQSHGQHK